MPITALKFSDRHWARLIEWAFLGLCTILPAPAQDVLTYHNDNARTGQNLTETILTPSNVNVNTFGLQFLLSVDGKVDAQPLYMSQVAIPGKGTHNLLLVVTEHDSVYGFDADTGASIWKVSLLKPGETTSDPRGCPQIVPEIGITTTPVVDRTRGPSGAIYAVAMSKDATGNYHQRLHALDVTTGAELFAGPVEIQATFPGIGDNSSGGKVIFDPKQYKERAGLLLLNGVVYTTWASHCDFPPYTGWIIGYNASTLARASVLNVVPNGSEGAIWMSGAGPATDSEGNIYLLDANGDFGPILTPSGFPTNRNFGNAFLKLSTAPKLAVKDYFEMDNEQTENMTDDDLGSGGALVLPDLKDATGHVWHLAVGAGKDTNLYLVNRDSMGKFDPSANNIYQELRGGLPGGILSMPAYFNGEIYYGPIGQPILAFQFTNAMLSPSPVSQTGNSFGFPGATPSISANGSGNAILWAAENGPTAVLHAYDPTDLSHELYNSNQAGTRDQFGVGNKFITPTIANGKVYVGTTSGVGTFGLLPALAVSPKSLTFPPQLTHTTSAMRNLTLTNSEGGPLTISAIAASGDFSQTNTCGATLAPRDKCIISVTFTPSTVGAVPGAITIADNGAMQPQVVAMAGTGLNPISLSPASLNFGGLAVGATSNALTFTLTNNQATAFNFGFSASSDYTAAPGGSIPCGSSLPANSKCIIAVTFTPTQSGLVNGSLKITSASFPLQLVNLSGIGLASDPPPLTISPPSLSFPDQLVGTASKGKTVTLQNSGASAVTISSLTASGDFTVTRSGASPCSSVLAAGAKCTLLMTFKPTILGLIKGSLTIAENAGASRQIYNLSASGVGPVTFSPIQLTFPPTSVGTSSAPTTLTLSNNQRVALSIANIAASGQYAVSTGGSSPCGSVLSASAKCTLAVTFTPSAYGIIPGVVTVIDSAAGSPQEVKLTGTGQ